MNVTLKECESITCPIDLTLVDVCDIPNYGCQVPQQYSFKLGQKIDTFDVTTTFLSAGAAKKCRFIKNWALSFGSLDLIANNTANRGNISTFSVTRNVNAVGSKF
jgi:hypothetical protein